MRRTTDIASYLVDKAKLDLMIAGDTLQKAQRDYSKLVKVRRPVTRKGKTFMQDIWVLPGQVKTSDVVLQNHHNVIPSLGSLTKPSAGMLDMKYFAALENTDKAKAMDYLKNLGFTWKTNSNTNINWMWAKNALNKFLNAHPSFKTTAGSVSSLLGGQSQPITQSTSLPQQIAQPTTVNTAVNKVSLMSSFTPQQQAEINACANGKEKFSKIREMLGKDGVISWAKANGITWNEHAHGAINIMRLGMAVREYFDNADGTVSLGPAIKAPKAPKDSTQKQPTTKVDLDKIPIPANATERTKNLIKHINNMTSIPVIESCTKMGMVPEDATAQSFIVSKFLPNFKAWVNADAPKAVKDKWKKDMGADLKTYGNTSWDWGERAIDKMNLMGYKKIEANTNLTQAFEGFSMGELISPRLFMNSSGDSIRSKFNLQVHPFHVISNLNYAYDDYVTDDYVTTKNGRPENYHPSNVGYIGKDPAEYLKKYDVEKEGFVRYLRKVQESNPSLKDTAQEMINAYDESMKMVGGNPNMLRYISKHEWDDDSALIYSTADFGNARIDKLSPEDMKKAIEIMELQYNAVVSSLKNAGYSLKTIEITLSSTWHLGSLRDIDVVDETGFIVGSVDATANLPTEAKQWTWAASRYAYYRFCKENGFENNTDLGKSAYEWVEQARQVATLDKDTYDTVRNNLKRIYGFQGDNNTSQLIDNKNYDDIWANIILTDTIVNMHNFMAYGAKENSKSPLNNNGLDYSGNYDYYSGKIMCDNSMNKSRLKQFNSGFPSVVSSTYTAQELSDKIQSQLDDAPVVTTEYLDNLRNYYASQIQGKTPNIDYDAVARQANLDTFWKSDYDKESNETPSKDIAFLAYSQMAKHIPKMAQSANLEQKLHKNFDYVPFDFSASVQPRFNKPKKTGKDTHETDLLKARKELLRKAKCSLYTEDEVTSAAMRQDFINHWDYTSGEQTPGGTVMPGKVHSGPNAPHGDQRALFNSRFFAVRNSVFEERFNKEHEKLKNTSNDAEAYTPMEVFHGTSYGCAPNILGREGEFFMGDSYTKVAKMLGPGVYVANKGGKSSVYIGKTSYANRQTGIQSGDADGIMMCLTVMKGTNHKSRSNGYHGSSSDKSLTSLEQDTGSLNDWEMAVKRNELVFPHHFVDISSRTINRNVKRNLSSGEYLDLVSGNSYDKDGALKGMK